jgi:hypothetical protein
VGEACTVNACASTSSLPAIVGSHDGAPLPSATPILLAGLTGLMVSTTGVRSLGLWTWYLRGRHGWLWVGTSGCAPHAAWGDRSASSEHSPSRHRKDRTWSRRSRVLALEGLRFREVMLDLRSSMHGTSGCEAMHSGARNDAPRAAKACGLAIEAVIMVARRLLASPSSPASRVTRRCKSSHPDAAGSTSQPSISWPLEPRSPLGTLIGVGSRQGDPGSKLRDPDIEAYWFEFVVTAPAGAGCQLPCSRKDIVQWCRPYRICVRPIVGRVVAPAPEPRAGAAGAASVPCRRIA